MGFKATLTEGAKHVLGWKSPNYLYCNAVNPRLKVLLRNFVLSDDIAFRFSNKGWSEWPLTTDKYVAWLNKLAPKSELLNIFIDYETFGEHHWKETGIFDFLSHLPSAVIKKTPFKFMTPSEVADTMQPVAAISVPSPVSWADEERDITAWLGNELQTAAFDKLYDLTEKVNKCQYEQLKKDWIYLQSSDHFYYMCTKWFSDGAVHAYFNPYETPYDAFMNYMNVLSDFEIRINRMCPATDEQIEILKLDSQLKARDETIAKLTTENKELKKKLEKGKSVKKTASEKTTSKVTRSLAQIAAEALAKSKVTAPKKKTAEKKTVAKKTKEKVKEETVTTPKTRKTVKKTTTAKKTTSRASTATRAKTTKKKTTK